MTYLFLSFNSDSINTVCLPKDLSVWERVSFLSGYFWQVAASLLYRPGPAKLKIVRVRSVLNDVSVPFASCLPNWRRSEYYSCQTVIIDLLFVSWSWHLTCNGNQAIGERITDLKTN